MRIVLGIVLLMFFQWGRAQEVIPKITLTYKDATREEVLHQIEEKTNLHFFYLSQWLGPQRISGDFKDVPVSKVLDSIFKDTEINYYVLSSSQIVLTQNNVIYDTLPEGFFGEDKSPMPYADINGESEAAAPVFYKEEKSARKKVTAETVRIGKENKSSRQNRYTLTGFVENAKTGEPIGNLSIRVKNKNTGVSTNDDGFYSIELSAGLNILETRSLGIEDSQKNVIIYNDGQYDFSLDESVEQLDEVVIQADAAKNVEKAGTGETYITSKESKNIPLVLGERDVLKVATTMPGITTAGEGASGFNVRGGNTDQNLILLDNGVIYNPSHFFGLFSALNPFTTNDVNIYKGYIPAEYGGRLSSVFDIRSKKSNTEKFSGEASIGPVTNNVAIELPVIKEKAGIMVGGRSTYSDYLLNTIDNPSLNNSSASFFDLIAKYDHNINENNDISATGYYSRDAFSINSDSLYHYSNQLFSVGWDHKFNEKNKGSLVLANSQYKFNIGYDGDSDNDFDLGYVIQETDLNINMKYLLNADHKFSYGLTSKLYNTQPGYIQPDGSESVVENQDIPDERGLESAVFISDNFKVNEKLLIDMGLRYSFYFALGPTEQRIYEDGVPKSEGTLESTQTYGKNEVSQTYGGPEVRVSARYFLMEDLSVKASFNSAYQYIHTLSNNTTSSPIDTWKLSDNNIRPARGNQYSLGLYKNFDGNTYEVSLEGYYKQSQDILDFKVGAQLLLNETIETEVLQGDGKAYGVELLLRKSGRLNGWIGYTYSRSLIKMDSPNAEERVNNGEYFPSNYDKPHDLSIVANYKFTRRYSMSANFVYQTGRPITYPVGRYTYNNAEYVFYSDRNAFRIPDYYRLDIGFNIEGSHKIKQFVHSYWNFSIYNVLGRNNPYSVYFVTQDGDVKAYQNSIFSVPVPTITYNFKF